MGPTPRNHDLKSILSTQKNQSNYSLEHMGEAALAKSQTVMLGSAMYDPKTMEASSENTLKEQSLEMVHAPDIEVKIESPVALEGRERSPCIHGSGQQETTADHLRTITLEGGYAFARRDGHNVSGAQEVTASVDRAYGGFFGDRVENKPLFKKKADRQSQKNRKVFGDFERKNDSY